MSERYWEDWNLDAFMGPLAPLPFSEEDGFPWVNPWVHRDSAVVTMTGTPRALAHATYVDSGVLQVSAHIAGDDLYVPAP